MQLRDLLDTLPTDSRSLRALGAELRAVRPLAQRVAPIVLRAALHPRPTLLGLVLDNARRNPNGLAFEMDHEQLTWADLDQLSSKVARVLAQNGVHPGENVALMGRNSPRYIAYTLAATRVGATVALINHHLVGAPLAHALETSRARVALVDEAFRGQVSPEHLGGGRVLHYGKPESELDAALARTSTTPYTPAAVRADDDFVYIYTSGTTGLPKPCRVSHARALLAGAAFSALMLELRPGDKIYSPLPLYHSSALLIGAGSAIAAGVPMAMREQFSARQFLPDVRRYGATAVLYIGELCRYLLALPPSPDDKNHRIRVASGNGLRPDVWPEFQKRFGIPIVREFYTATEAPGFLVNLSGTEGSVGRAPLGFDLMLKLAKYDVDADEHVRDARGFCVPAAVDEPGELLIRLPSRVSIPGLEYRGYTDAKASNAKVMTDVFTKGDRYFRTGDMLRRDASGFYAFVDRIGDTFRCKGENVSTAEVGDVLGQTPGIHEVAVVGVQAPKLDGQFGLAAVVVEPGKPFDPEAFARTAAELPSYARPRFVRVLSAMASTSTHKQQKAVIRREGFDPREVNDPMYVLTEDGYVPLTKELHASILDGRFRL